MRNKFALKIERQFIIFISTLLSLHLLFRFMGWDFQDVWLILIPFLFSIINLFGFVLKGFRKSIWEFKYFLIVLLYLMLALKVEFRHYNIFFAILLVVISVYVLRYKDFRIPKLQHRLTFLIILNIFAIATPDTLVFEYILSADKQIWGNKLKWFDFKGNEPKNIGDMDARINSDIYWKCNRVHNRPRFITLAVMEKYGSWVRPACKDYEGNLLKHEQLHFDITEWTRREFHDSLNNCEKVNCSKANDINDYFEKVLSTRQEEYDSISKHGIDFNGQIKWNKKVKQSLN